MQSVYSIVIVVAFLLSYAVAMPMIEPSDNFVLLSTLVQLFAVLFCSLLLRSPDVRAQMEEQFGADVFANIVTFVLASSVAILLLSQLWELASSSAGDKLLGLARRPRRRCSSCCRAQRARRDVGRLPQRQPAATGNYRALPMSPSPTPRALELNAYNGVSRTPAGGDARVSLWSSGHRVGRVQAPPDSAPSGAPSPMTPAAARKGTMRLMQGH